MDELWPMRHRALYVLMAFFAAVGGVLGQAGVTTFGLQVKPVIPFSFFEPETKLQLDHLSASVQLNGGLAFGMVVRKGLGKALSMETGLSQITRKYGFGIVNDTNGYNGSGSLRFVGYELPVVCLVYVRLGQRTWMNNALGVSLDMYPSDAHQELDYGQAYFFRRNWAQIGVVGNIGVEYRTDHSGYFYGGATFHRPFGDMAQADVSWLDRYKGFQPHKMIALLNGSYLTLDLRYFFHEDPDKARRRQAGPR